MMKDIIYGFQNNTRGGVLLRQVFNYCLKHGESTIPQIAAALKFSVPAITKQVTELCKVSLLTDCGKSDAREGRPASLYGVNANSCFFVGVDIHQFSLSIGIMNLSGKIVQTSIDRSFVLEDSRAMLDSICVKIKQFIKSVCAENQFVSADKILNVNVNLAGRINPKTGFSHSMFYTGETPLSEIISKSIGYSTTIENDTRAMAYGEFSNLNDPSVSNMLYINAGYGIGLGIIINGELYSGRSGYAGEFGHMFVYDNGLLCRCGKVGCLETEVSGGALLRRVTSALENSSESCLIKNMSKKNKITIYDIINAITKYEDMMCIDLLEEIAIQIGRNIANMINIFNPDRVVVGGLLSLTGDYILNPIKMSINKYALTLVSKETEIVISDLKEKAGVVGACMLARYRIFNN